MEEFGVIIDNHFIYEKESKKIPKQTISKITLKYGFASSLIIFQALTSGILAIIFVPLFFYNIELKNFISFRGVAALLTMPMLFIGGICYMCSIFFRGYFLEIITNSGIKRIDFVGSGAEEKSRIDKLLNHARNLGYPIFFETDENVVKRLT